MPTRRKLAGGSPVTEVVFGLVQLGAVVTLGAGIAFGLAYAAGGRHVSPVALVAGAAGAGVLAVATLAVAVFLVASTATVVGAIRTAGRRRLGALAVLLLLTALLVGLAWFLFAQDLTRADQRSSVIGLFVSIASVLVGVASLLQSMYVSGQICRSASSGVRVFAGRENDACLPPAAGQVARPTARLRTADRRRRRR
ncbi:hypothetical protein [Cryptosporangium sp. NPDC051539]|uniref:hypothetical protein n=1 Tax=Cryptosporangium sp. NPDC051539 TaxID=3363962 RepID=UPI003787E7F0